MPIDLEHEHPITFAQLAESLPRRRKNRPVHPSTIHRWRMPGIRGVQLEAIRIDCAWHTTIEAFARFCERLTVREGGSQVLATSRHGKNQQQVANAELEKDGW